MNNQTTFADCSTLASRGSFADYVQQLNSTTSFNETLLRDCQSEICNALWGVGNADISGIGMIVGYFFESILGLLFALSLTTLRLLPPKLSRFKPLFKKVCTVFFDSAVFFAMSIQIACVIVLVRRDFGVSANGLGGFTTQITWAIALLSMLPLLYTLTVLDTIETTRSGYRFSLFCGCWVLFFYTFVSQMIGDFAPSQMGEGAGEGATTLITNDEWEKLNTLCLSGIRTLSTKEQNILSGFGAAGSLFIIIYGLIRLLIYIVLGILPSFIEKSQSNFSKFLKRKNYSIYITYAWCLIIFLLTIPQFWGVLRLRGIQRSLAGNTNNTYVDNQWTFGQVLAVMIFAPVFTEMGFLCIRGGKGVDEGSQTRGKERVETI